MDRKRIHSTLLSMIGMALKVSTEKRGQGSRNKEGRNPPIFVFGSELLNYLTYWHEILCEDTFYQYRPKLTKTDRDRSKLIETDQNGPKSTHMDRHGQDRPRQTKINGRSRIEMDRDRPRRTKTDWNLPKRIGTD